MDPYQWHESVLSTRSLSFISTGDALGSPGLPMTPGMHSRTASYGFLRNASGTRRDTLDSEPDLEMMSRSGVVAPSETERLGGLRDIPELPESVAESLLFTLPREIRDRIYSFCLTARHGAPVDWPAASTEHGLQPQLLQTCRIIHSEAAPLLYSLNILSFDHPSDANMLVHAIASPAHASHVTTVALHIKTHDTRLWMPYLTSSDPHRSLKGDFPSIRELFVRYRSNKWNHVASPESNMKTWCEDSRLDEVVDGLRHVYLPPAVREMRAAAAAAAMRKRREISEHEFLDYIEARRTASRPGSASFSTAPSALDSAPPKARPSLLPLPDPPSIRVVCSCRIHLPHFQMLRGLAPMPEPAQPLAHSLVRLAPVREGDAFRGFTLADLRGEPRGEGSDVLRTAFAEKEGVLVALEVFCPDAWRDREGT